MFSLLPTRTWGAEGGRESDRRLWLPAGTLKDSFRSEGSMLKQPRRWLRTFRANLLFGDPGLLNMSLGGVRLRCNTPRREQCGARDMGCSTEATACGGLPKEEQEQGEEQEQQQEQEQEQAQERLQETQQEQKQKPAQEQEPEQEPEQDPSKLTVEIKYPLAMKWGPVRHGGEGLSMYVSYVCTYGCIASQRSAFIVLQRSVVYVCVFSCFVLYCTVLDCVVLCFG